MIAPLGTAPRRGRARLSMIELSLMAVLLIVVIIGMMLCSSSSEGENKLLGGSSSLGALEPMVCPLIAGDTRYVPPGSRGQGPTSFPSSCKPPVLSATILCCWERFARGGTMSDASSSREPLEEAAREYVARLKEAYPSINEQVLYDLVYQIALRRVEEAEGV